MNYNARRGFGAANYEGRNRQNNRSFPSNRERSQDNYEDEFYSQNDAFYDNDDMDASYRSRERYPERGFASDRREGSSRRNFENSNYRNENPDQYEDNYYQNEDVYEASFDDRDLDGRRNRRYEDERNEERYLPGREYGNRGYRQDRVNRGYEEEQQSYRSGGRYDHEYRGNNNQRRGYTGSNEGRRDTYNRNPSSGRAYRSRRNW